MNKQVEYVLKMRRKQAAYNARQALDELFCQAREKKQKAILEYAELVWEHVGNLNSLIETHRELLLPFSRNCCSWPMQISKRKGFGDNPDDLIDKLKVGEDTVANDSATRFDLTKKFGRLALNLIMRIEYKREPVSCQPSYPTPSWAKDLFPTPSTPTWVKDARKLPKFTRKASTEEQKQWLTVVNQVLEDDLRNPNRLADYRSLITAPSHKDRWKAVLFDKVRGEFDSLWKLHSQKRKVKFS